MGKKSKRARPSRQQQPQESPKKKKTPPALRKTAEGKEDEEEETKDNLRFQDPFVDEYMSEDDDSQDEEETQEDSPTTNTGEIIKSWNPLTGAPLAQGQTLEMDPSAYKMHHAFSNEWPSLSFDFVRDDLGESRTRFPHSLMAVLGTQASSIHQNQVTLVKLSDLGRIPVETEDDILGEEYDKQDDNSDDGSDSEEEEVELDPVLEHVSVPHHGGVNRVRVLPQRSEIVATWSDQGVVNVFDVSSWMDSFSGHSKGSNNNDDKVKDPVHVYKGHCGVEGYAMDWSRVTAGNLATGDCNGNIHLWQPDHDVVASPERHPSFHAAPSYESETSVEDLQWSPTERTVLAAASCGGHVRIYDTRAPHRAMLTHQLHHNNSKQQQQQQATDINVLSWNRLVTNLMATGADDGTLSVWDLRNAFKEPLARFTSHRTPITSLEWHPTDESMLAVSDDVGTYVYDLSIEQDDDDDDQQQQLDGGGEEEIPPQLLFVHCGSEQFKEAHWHPQITSCIMTTALTGFSVFIPSNL